MTNTRNALIAAALTTSLAVTVGAAAVASSAEFEPKPMPAPTVTETTTVDVPRNFPVPGPTVTKKVVVRETVHVSRQKRSVPRTAPVTGSVKEYARSLVGDAQWPCLNSLIAKESGWNHTATNPSSGAYGLPQALPGSKMASAGGDWRTNPRTQLRWMKSYIESRYGSPCGAWNHSQQKGWY